MYEIITVATHKDGMFEDLINNKFKHKVKVLGYNQKWTNFKMKTELIYDYIKNLNDNKIIIYVDGFDSLIMKDPIKAVKLFKNNKYKLLFSLENNNFFGLVNHVFPKCKKKKKLILNAGMYMGYVKYLKIILNNLIKTNCNDDQIIVNNLCESYNFIKIDTKQIIFQNLTNKNNYNNQAIFISFPGNINIKRIHRSFIEYSQFFLLYFDILFFILFIIFLKLNKLKKIYLLVLISLIYYIFYRKIDKSCI